MARAPHKLSAKKLAEGIGGLRVMHDVGAKVHLLRHLKLHGKIVIADGKKAIVGSINLSPGSFDSRRELAIETKSKEVLKRLVQISRRYIRENWTCPMQEGGPRNARQQGHGGACAWSPEARQRLKQRAPLKRG